MSLTLLIIDDEYLRLYVHLSTSTSTSIYIYVHLSTSTHNEHCKELNSCEASFVKFLDNITINKVFVVLCEKYLNIQIRFV